MFEEAPALLGDVVAIVVIGIVSAVMLWFIGGIMDIGRMIPDDTDRVGTANTEGVDEPDTPAPRRRRKPRRPKSARELAKRWYTKK